MLEAKNGWSLKYFGDLGKNNVENYNRVGVIGRSKIGKTFFINELSGLNLPCGDENKTEGLSVKYVDEKSLLFIDTAGIDRSSCLPEDHRNDEKKMSQKTSNKSIDDGIMTNYFIRNS